MRGYQGVSFSILCVALMVATSFEPAVEGWVKGVGDADGNARADIVPGPYRDLKKLVDDLLEVTVDRTDTDADGLPNSVERIIGTDPDKADSDYDTLNDSYEVSLNIDPLKADSNGDGLVDPKEVNGVDIDADHDGVTNPWDRDNDNDGFEDRIDRSPNACTGLLDSVHLDLKTTGKPLYITIQIRPRDPDNLRSMMGSIDWPYDDKGLMQDLDNSSVDVLVSPVLKIKGNVLPKQDDVVEYGMKVGDEEASAPLSAEWDLGRVVGLGGKIFYPGTKAPTELSMNLTMEWVVTGITDMEVRTIKANDQMYLTALGSGIVRANSSDRSEPQRFGWERIGDGKVALRASDGYYLGIGTDGKLTSGLRTRGENCVFTIVEDKDYYYITDEDGEYLVLMGDRTVGTSSERSENARFVIAGDGVRKSAITLIVYPDRFLVASLSVTENFGSEIGLFYSSDAEQMIAANMFISSSYMRNYSLEMEDMPDLLSDRNVVVRHTRGSYPHSDLAVKDSIGRMAKEALENLSGGDGCSITTMMEDSTSIADLTNGSSSDGGSFSANMSNVPVITTRLMRSTWYDPPSKEPLGPETFLLKIEPLLDPLLDGDKKAMIGMVLYWNVGEIRIMKIGDEVRENETHYWAEDVAKWMGGISGSIMFVANFIKDFVLPVLEFLTFVYNLYSTSSAFMISFIKGTFAPFMFILKSFKDWGAWGTTAARSLFGIGIVISVLGYVLDMTILIFNLVAMYSAAGSDPFQITLTTIYAAMAFSWVTALFGVGLFFSILTFILSLQAIPVGGQVAGFIIGAIVAVVGLLYALEELITSLITGKSGSEWIITWIIGLISGVRSLTEVDMDLVSSSLLIDDVSGNGLDSSDIIEFKSVWNATVTRVDGGTTDQLDKSYISPEYRISVPNRGSTDGGFAEIGTYLRMINNYTTGDVKNDQFEAGAWVRPGAATVNYQVVLDAMMNYSRYYQEYLFWGLIPFPPKTDSGVSVMDTSVHYFDVMPSTIDGLTTWSYLTRSDTDGDGINDTEERTTDPMKWDTDGDQLGDKFELDMGYLPNASDTDHDGLPDMGEMLADLDPGNPDTDGDGLTDLQELEGWVINLTYCDHPFEWHIVSDPGLPDTDGDGLNDTIEYLTLQNPMSKDTNGDGIIDELLDYSTTEMEYVDTIGGSGEFYQIYDLALDGDGNIVIVGGKNATVTEIGPDGKAIWEFVNPEGSGYNNYFRHVEVGPDGRIYASTPGSVYVMNGNGSYNSTIDLEPAFLAETLFVDVNGIICAMGTIDSFGVHLIRIYPNGTMVWEHSFQCGDLESEGFPITNWKGSAAMNSKGEYLITDPTRDRILVFDRDYNWIKTWDMGLFGVLRDIWIDGSDSIYICGYDEEYDLVQKLDRYRRVVVEWSTDLLETSIVSGGDGMVYIGGTATTGPFTGRIMEFRENVTVHKAQQNRTYLDTDGEGLTDVLEEAGWDVTILSQTGTLSYHVNSSIGMTDTDLDGLDDLREYGLGSNPRSPDTDLDGLQDQEEIGMDTNLTSWDTDGDGLGDAGEITFHSDPLLIDTEGDGLPDNDELAQGSDPNRIDTDDDGLTDKEEWDLGWDPVCPDGDGDFMFDGDEKASGCDPKIPDADRDGIDDGYERLFMTEPLNDDCDSDGLPDGFEVESRMDPNSNDTDGDGMTDPSELEVGYNPRNRDSDGDGTPDGNDMDFDIDLGEDVILTIDESATSAGFISDLSDHTNVKVVTPQELIQSYTTSHYIVIVGRPSALNGTAGAIATSVLSDRDELLQSMLTSDVDRCVVRYGFWTGRQTVVILSAPYPNDYSRVLGILKSMRMTVENGTAIADYVSPCRFFDLSLPDMIGETDSSVAGSLKANAAFRTEVSLVDDPAPLERLSDANALGPDELAVEKYVRLEMTYLDGNAIPTENISMVSLRTYYTLEDLDLSGDGDAEDSGDLNESTLILCGNHNGTWTQLSEADWVGESGVDTNDLTIAGKQYAGYLWMKGVHLSTYGIAGKRNDQRTFSLDVGPVSDKGGVPLSGANVSLVFSRTEYKNATGIDGHTTFIFSEIVKGDNVIVSVEKDGYRPIFYKTAITQDGTLEAAPPRLERIVEEKNGGGPDLMSYIIMAVLALFLAIAILLLLRKRGKTPRW